MRRDSETVTLNRYASAKSQPKAKAIIVVVHWEKRGEIQLACSRLMWGFAMVLITYTFKLETVDMQGIDYLKTTS